MRRVVWVLSFFVFACFPAHANFDNQVNDLLHQTLPQASMGLVVMDPSSNTLVYTLRAKDNFHPASNTKLISATAALQLLGPDFHFETSLRANPALVHDNTVQGDLAVVFTGDPSFTSNDLRALFQQLKTQHIIHITGDILIDDTAFDGPYYGPGWTHDSIVWAYSAPVSAIVIDENKTAVHLAKTIKANDKIPLQGKVQGELLGVTRETAKTTCQILAYSKDNQLHIEGCYPFADTPTVLECAIDSPRLLAQEHIEKNLAALGIMVDGKIRFGKAPADTQIVAEKQSPPLHQLLIPLLADSNNLYAECITKTLGIITAGRGTFQSGTQAIKEHLQNTGGLSPTQYVLADGSGQSRYNLISPLTLTQLLYSMQLHPDFESFYHALSVSGVNGTLATRMPELKGKVIAKTGSANGTSALSGYIIANSGKTYIFSIMLNQIANANKYQAKQLEDQLCALIAKEAWLSNNSTVTGSQIQ